MGDNGSPFIYPKYGLGVLPEAYVSRCAQDGGMHEPHEIGGSLNIIWQYFQVFLSWAKK